VDERRHRAIAVGAVLVRRNAPAGAIVGLRHAPDVNRCAPTTK
jgi:hypothetical protein